MDLYRVNHAENLLCRLIRVTEVLASEGPQQRCLPRARGSANVAQEYVAGRLASSAVVFPGTGDEEGVGTRFVGISQVGKVSQGNFVI
jgi:hypothetical protein